MVANTLLGVSYAASRCGCLVAIAYLGVVVACSPAVGSVTDLSLSAQTLRFKTSREDITVKAAWLQFRCLMPLSDSSAGVGQPAGATYGKCRGFSINGQEIDTYTSMIELSGAAPNTVHIDRLRISFSGPGSYLCIALRAIFSDIPHQDDVDLYAVSGDRYSLASYCSVEVQPDSAPNRYPFEQNRVGSIAEFAGKLSRPIEVRLKPGPRRP